MSVSMEITGRTVSVAEAAHVLKIGGAIEQRTSAHKDGQGTTLIFPNAEARNDHIAWLADYIRTGTTIERMLNDLPEADLRALLASHTAANAAKGEKLRKFGDRELKRRNMVAVLK